MDVPHAPKAPSEQLRLESFRTLTWLRLVFEFRPWLEHIWDYSARDYDNPVKLLWSCFLLGAPLCTLLDLLGSPTPKQLAATPESFDFNLSLEKRRDYISYFIDRIRILENQRQLPYGEVLRPEDFFQSTSAGFFRVLQTVRRVLNALYEVYPGLFSIPHGSTSRRTDLVKQLTLTEKDHVSKLFDMVEAASQLLAQADTVHTVLETFTLSCSRICQFHGHVMSALERITLGGDCEPWDDIFLFHNKPLRTNTMGCYRSICASYLSFRDYLEQQLLNPALSEHATIILTNLSEVLSRISTYNVLLQSILDLTPIESYTHDALCGVTAYMNDISGTIEEVGKEVRTMLISQLLKAYITIQSVWNYEDLGAVELDDILFGDAMSSQKYHMVVFEKAIFCFTTTQPTNQLPFKNPIKPWELGAAMSSLVSALKILYHIPRHDLKEMHCIDGSFFEIIWQDSTNTKKTHTLPLYPAVPHQYEQWFSLLRILVPQISYWNSVLPDSSTNSEATWVFDEDSLRRSSVAKAWSVVGRKGTHSECSSMVLKSHHDTISLLSPELLPTLFSITPDSPLDNAFQLEINIPSGPEDKASPVDSGLFIEDDSSLLVTDLTGKIIKCGNYPAAHGGYSDVWKGKLTTTDSFSSLVGVKVFRRISSDPESENKVIKKLYKELKIWQKLNHPHIIPILGTAGDFGPYLSFVCPWLENGSVTKYMEGNGDILSIADRLKLLCEIADGLAYLHAHSIVHGDLSGSNVLVDNNRKACLCDFGLSNVIEEIGSNSYSTTSIAGSVRWTDANLFCPTEDETPRAVTTKSDIYSYGSIMLEILTGRIPYHYIRTDAQVVIELYQGKKPRRPAASFVDDEQWLVIQKCWADDPDARPIINDVQGSVVKLYNKYL